MEHSMYLIGKHISIYQKQNSGADLDEVLMGAEAFHAIARELKKRHVA